MKQFFINIWNHIKSFCISAGKLIAFSAVWLWSNIKPGLAFFYRECIKFPTYIIFHPLKGFEEFKRYKRGKMSVALILMFLTILFNILSFQYNGFLTNPNDIKDLNSIAQIAYIVGLVIVVTIGNWSVTTLFSGKGTMKEIFMMICYCLFPFMISKVFGLFLSNVLTTNELAIYSLVNTLGVFIMVFMFFFGIISIHEYGLVQCLLTILFTIIAVVIVLFACLLFFDLFQRMYGFIYTIYQELTLRNIIGG